MILNLSSKEWHYVLQMIYRFNNSNEVTQYQKTCLSNLKVLIPYSRGIFYLASREDDHITHYAPISENILEPRFEEIFMQKNYPNSWVEFQFSPWSCVKRNSDIYDNDVIFEGTRVYRELYQPQDIYHAIQMVLIHNDTLLGILAIFRPKNEPDFSLSELQCMDILKEHLALRLYQLRESSLHEKKLHKQLQPLEKFDFTKREIEIIELVAAGMMDNEISEKLFISISTLRKHLSNIYRKADITSRIQLIHLARHK